MKRIFHILLLSGLVLTTWAQGTSALEQLKADPRKAYGTDYPYSYENFKLTKFPYYRWQDFKKFYTDRCNSVQHQ